MLDNRCDSAANSVLSPLLHAALRILWNTTEALSANSERRPSTIQKKLAVGLYGHAFFWGWTQPQRKPGWIMRAMPHAYLVLWDLSCTSQAISKQEQVLQGFLFEEKTSQPFWAPFPQLDHTHYKSLPNWTSLVNDASWIEWCHLLSLTLYVVCSSPLNRAVFPSRLPSYAGLWCWVAIGHSSHGLALPLLNSGNELWDVFLIHVSYKCSIKSKVDCT